MCSVFEICLVYFQLKEWREQKDGTWYMGDESIAVWNMPLQGICFSGLIGALAL